MANTPSGGSPHARWQGDFLHLCRLRLPEPDDRPGEAGAAARHFVETGGRPSILPGACTPEDADVGKGSAWNRPQVSGSRIPQERPP